MTFSYLLHRKFCQYASSVHKRVHNYLSLEFRYHIKGLDPKRGVILTHLVPSSLDCASKEGADFLVRLEVQTTIATRALLLHRYVRVVSAR